MFGIVKNVTVLPQGVENQPEMENSLKTKNAYTWGFYGCIFFNIFEHIILTDVPNIVADFSNKINCIKRLKWKPHNGHCIRHFGLQNALFI